MLSLWSKCYEWSQEMRRCEVRVRQMKDCVNLARATGDELLRQRCQGQITELNKYYRELAGKAGIGAECRRTYVAGFREGPAADGERWQKYSIRYSPDVMAGERPSSEVTTAVADTSERVLNDFPGLRNHLELITYGYDRDGAAGAARSDGKEIILDIRSFKSMETLRQVLSENVKSGHTAKTENPMFVVAHEMGHCIETMVAMKRVGISSIRTTQDVSRLRAEKQAMFSEYYLHMGFTDESFEEIMDTVGNEIGLYAKNNPKELFANSLGIWYYGIERHPHVDALVDYMIGQSR